MNRKFRAFFWQAIFVLILVWFASSAFVRFFMGIGAATNLTDTFPWGIWVGFDILIGIGLASGGFIIAATVYIFRLERYKPIVRPAILTAFIGYLLEGAGLMFDLGQPMRIYHPIFMWNESSAMFVVAWCVILAIVILGLEFSPALFERFKMHVPLKIIRRLYLPLVILGTLLAIVHQSALGLLFVIVPEKLHSLWYTPILPLLFLISSIGAGLCMTIIESYLSYRAFGMRLENHLLRGLARVAVVVFSVYATLRIYDIIARDMFFEIFQLKYESVLFAGEFGLGVILPIFLLARSRTRNSQGGLFFASVMAVCGFAINRLNVSTTGLYRSTGVEYFPSWAELGVTVGLSAIGFFLFAMAVKFLHVFPEEHAAHAVDRDRRRPAFNAKVLLGFWAMITMGAISIFIAGSPVEQQAKASVEIAVEPEAEWTLPEDFAFPQGEDSPGEVTFSHDSHASYMDNNCMLCHSDTWSMLTPATPKTGELTYERIHEEDLCYSCHSGEEHPDLGMEIFSTQDFDSCDSCHW